MSAAPNPTRLDRLDHVDFAAALHNTLRCALNVVLLSDYSNEGTPSYHAAADHAEEQLALAARDLVRAVEAMPPGDRPIGWDAEGSA